jgi:L,D-peptidoglycan transpeptidase YkuD (ErfK/YbiS/YcfS/YnhG family)
VVVGASLVMVAVHEGLRRRPQTQPPVELLDRANLSLGRARQAGAARWAPEELAVAETVVRQAWTSYQLQSNRLEALRDFRPVTAELHEADRLALRAERVATETHGAADAKARAELANAHQTLQDALRVERVTSLPRPERARLQRARLRLTEAAALLEAGSCVEAGRKAMEAALALRTAIAPALNRVRRFEDSRALARWRQAVEETRSWSRASGKAAVLVFKAQNRLDLLVAGRLARRYDADMGANGTSNKLSAGDLATPEGHYRVTKRLDRGASHYYRALVLDYPNDEDRRRFREARAARMIPPGAQIGGLIEIHGEGGRGKNWTRGCVALSNPDMDDLFARVTVGTPVTIVGSDGSLGAFSDVLNGKRASQ